MMTAWQDQSDRTDGVRQGLKSLAIADAGEQAAAQPWIGMECYQLSRGRQLAQMRTLDLGDQQIVIERQEAGVQKLGATPPNLCTVSYCTPDPAFRFSDHAADGAETIFFMPGNTAFDLHVPAGSQTGYVSFCQDEFVRGAQILNPRAWANPPRQVTPFRTRQKAALGRAMALWLRSAATTGKRSASLQPALLRTMVLQAALQIVTSTDNGETRALSPGARSRALCICRMARDYVEARLAAQALPTVLDICSMIGVSERTLQYAFHDYIGMSPQAYLRLCRLNRVRATLQAGTTQTLSVTQVAMDYGFLHLGRFAGDYKQLFDESPSATLAAG